MNIAIIGCTGAVGKEFINLIEERKFNYNNIKLVASKRSINSKIQINNKLYSIIELNYDIFDDIKIAFFFVSSELSSKYISYASKKNIICIDNSSAFRMSHPLIVPEINFNTISGNIIANPNCCTIILCMLLYPLNSISKIERVIVSTYQAISGAGYKCINELNTQIKQYNNNQEITKNYLKSQCFNNVFSHDTDIDINNGYNGEENKIINETKKILNISDLKITATCIRVPVFRSHCESVNVTFKDNINESDIRNILNTFPGVSILDDRNNNNFPESIKSELKDNILIGRIRKDLSEKNSYNFFISGDQLRKGAALNAIQIAELLNK